MLTPRQHQTLTFIAQSIDERGFAPSLEEICTQLGLASKSGPHRLIDELVEKGYVRRLGKRSRALEVVKHGDRDPGDASVEDLRKALVSAHLRIAELEEMLAAARGRQAA